MGAQKDFKFWALLKRREIGFCKEVGKRGIYSRRKE